MKLLVPLDQAPAWDAFHRRIAVRALSVRPPIPAPRAWPLVENGAIRLTIDRDIRALPCSAFAFSQTPGTSISPATALAPMLDSDGTLKLLALEKALIAEDVKTDTRELGSTEAFLNGATEEVTSQGFGPFGGRPRMSIKTFVEKRRAFLLSR